MLGLVCFTRHPSYPDTAQRPFPQSRGRNRCDAQGKCPIIANYRGGCDALRSGSNIGSRTRFIYLLISSCIHSFLPMPNTMLLILPESQLTTRVDENYTRILYDPDDLCTLFHVSLPRNVYSLPILLVLRTSDSLRGVKKPKVNMLSGPMSYTRGTLVGKASQIER